MASIKQKPNDLTDEEGNPEDYYPDELVSPQEIMSDPEIRHMQPHPRHNRLHSRHSRTMSRPPSSATASTMHAHTLEPALDGITDFEGLPQGIPHSESQMRISTHGSEAESIDTQPPERTNNIRGRQTPMIHPVRESHFMEEHNSYHGPLSGEEAVKRLKKAIGDAYLTRFSPSHGYYVLTVLKHDPSQIVGHFRLNINSHRKQYSVHGMEGKFNSMDDLLAHYERHRIHPMFDTIGGRLTLQRFTAIAQKWSCVVQ